MNERDHFDKSLDDVLRDVDLLCVIGRLLYERHPEILENDPHYMNWLTRELRRRPPQPGDWDATQIARARRRILARVWAERCGVADGGAAGPALRDTLPATMAQSVDDAAQARCAPVTVLAAAAGEGREIWDEECDRWLELPPEVESGRYVAIRVAGDSMTPLFHDRDTILVRLGKEARSGSVVVARKPDSGYVVKRVGRARGAHLELVSLNPAYEPVLLPRREGAILGTVVMRWSVHDDVIPFKR